MKFHNELMSSADTQKKKIGDFAVRSERNLWAETIEATVRECAPFPITYDVSAVQSTNFSEYNYTELAGGMWIATQSLELNARLIDFASQIQTDKNLDQFAGSLQDKYVLQDPTGAVFQKVCFLPGHNMLDVASIETIARLAHEDEAVMFKLHPITNMEATDMIRKRVGWHRIIDRKVSGMALLRNCEEVYTSTASEMAITGTALGKKVFNISNFFNEGTGAYHVISRILFKAHRESVAAAQQKLINIIECPWSGLMFPWHTDVQARIADFYAKSLELRELYKPLASPKGNPPSPRATK